MAGMMSFFRFLMTLKISFWSYGFAILFGLLGTGAKLSQHKVLRGIAVAYTTVVRSLPEILMVLIVYFTVAGLAKRTLFEIGLVNRGFQFNPFGAAVFAFAFVSGAFMAEVLRAGRLAIPEGQIEAATAIGMSNSRLLRIVQLFQCSVHLVSCFIPFSNRPRKMMAERNQ